MTAAQFEMLEATEAEETSPGPLREPHLARLPTRKRARDREPPGVELLDAIGLLAARTARPTSYSRYSPDSHSRRGGSPRARRCICGEGPPTSWRQPAATGDGVNDCGTVSGARAGSGRRAPARSIRSAGGMGHPPRDARAIAGASRSTSSRSVGLVRRGCPAQARPRDPRLRKAPRLSERLSGAG